MEILIIKTTSLGDVLHGTTALPQLAAAFPGARITWVVDRGAAALVRHHPSVNRIIESDFLGWEKRFFRKPLSVLGEVGRLLRELRETRYDRVYDLQGLLRTVLLLLLSKSPSKWVKGNWPFVKGFGDKKRLHAVEEIRKVLEVSGIPTFHAPMALHLPGGESIPHTSEKSTGHPTILLSPFTGWVSKTWPLARWGELIDLCPPEWELVFTGAPADRKPVEELLSRHRHPRVKNALGEWGLVEYATAVKGASLVITGEGFPAHVASASGTPVVILMGPTTEWRIGPVGTAFRLLRADGCHACYDRTCRRGCLGRIGPGAVLDAAMGLLREPTPSPTPWLPKL